MEHPNANTRDAFGIFMRRLIDKTGYATMGPDRPAWGESQGDCSKGRPCRLQQRVFSFLAARDHAVRGVVRHLRVGVLAVALGGTAEAGGLAGPTLADAVGHLQVTGDLAANG